MMEMKWSALVATMLLVDCASADGPAPALIPYATAHERPLDAAESLDSETEKYRRLHVEFDGIERDRVSSFLYLPKGYEGKRPAVLLQYGIGGNKNTNYIVAIGEQFASHGFVVLTIDSPGRGDRRSKDKKRTDWFFSNDGRDLFVQYCGDYSRAIDYLSLRSDVDTARIGYVGISWGGITGITFVAHDPRVRAMSALVSGGGFVPSAGLFNGDALKEKPLPIDPIHHVAQIAPRPLLLMNVTRDQLVPRPFAEALHRAAREGSKIVWLDADHAFNGVDRGEVGESVIQFMKDSLPPRE